MKPSLARSEFNIRQRLLRGAKIDALPIDALPADLQDFTADLLSVVVDAAVAGSPEAVERLRVIAKQFGARSPDAHQAERWAAVKIIDEDHDAGPLPPSEPAAGERRANMLRHRLAALDPAFYELDLAFVESQLLKVRSGHELAARLSLECGAFGDAYASTARAAKAATVASVKRLYTRAMTEPSRKG